MNVILISELVNKDGSRIKGGAKIDQDNNMTTSKITTDDFVHMTRQGLSMYNNFGRIYYGESDDTNDDVELPPEDKEEILTHGCSSRYCKWGDPPPRR